MAKSSKAKKTKVKHKKLREFPASQKKVSAAEMSKVKGGAVQNCVAGAH